MARTQGWWLRLAMVSLTVAAPSAGRAQLWSERVLHQFQGAPEGSRPIGRLLLASDGNFYGTTAYGGAYGRGSVFKIARSTSGVSVVTTLHSFTDADGGAMPLGALMEASDGSLYGTTIGGGRTVFAGGRYTNTLDGTIFRLRRDTSGEFTVFANTCFAPRNVDNLPTTWPANPSAGLVEGADGDLYGTTVSGGYARRGAVIRVDKELSAITVVHAFAADYSEGFHPTAQLLLARDGNLYGTTYNYYGGASGPNSGTVFQLARGASGHHDQFSLLHAFPPSPINTGNFAYGSGLMESSTGDLYGLTAVGGGTGCGGAGCGTAYQLSRDANGQFTVFRQLHAFQESTSGANPMGELVQAADGSLYGACFGGYGSGGNVFRLSPGADGLLTQLSIVHAFGTGDLISPNSGPILGREGQLYGTAVAGGLDNNGGVYEIAPAVANYVCKALNAPGASWTQLLQLNDAGGVVANTDLGPYVYSGGAWLALPPPPASSGYTAADLAAISINDSGVVVGTAVSAADGSRGQGFTLAGGTYDFFSYQPALYPNTEPRGIGSSGVITGMAYDPGASQGVAFIYNANGDPRFRSGFSEVVPMRADGTRSALTIPGRMNGLGQFVGSAQFRPGGRYGFLFDPAAAPPVSLFRLGALQTSPRGINDRGDMAGFARDATGPVFGFVQTAGAARRLTCSTIPADADVYLEHINNSGVIVGGWSTATDPGESFLAYPNVAMPVSTVNGAFTFDVPVSASVPVFLDPALAVGYEYKIAPGNPFFTSVTLPLGIGDNVFTLLVGKRTFTLPAEQRFDFTANGFSQGVEAFKVMGLEPAAALDPADQTAFVTEVTFAQDGVFSGTMSPMTPMAELGDLVKEVRARTGGWSLLAMMVATAEALYEHDRALAGCRTLKLFERELQRARRLDRTAAAYLTAEVQAVRGALGCQ